MRIKTFAILVVGVVGTARMIYSRMSPMGPPPVDSPEYVEAVVGGSEFYRERQTTRRARPRPVFYDKRKQDRF